MINLTLVSYDGHTINSSAYSALIDSDAPLFPDVAAQYVYRNRAWPRYAGKELSEFELPITIAIHSGGSSDELMGWFDVESDPKTLVVSDGSNQWSVQAAPVRVGLGEANTEFTAVLSLADPIWQGMTQNSDTWAITTSGAIRVVTASGNRFARPILEITPTGTTTSGFAYRRFVPVLNQTDRAFNGYPLELAGGLNTAALVTAGKMQAGGNDFRAMMDGVQVNRWLSGINTTSTKLWINLDLAPKIELSLGTAIASSGVIGEIQFKATDANKAAVKKLPANGMLIIGSEIFTFSGVDTKRLKVGGVTRAARGTAMAAHAIGDTVKRIEHDVWLIYGDSSVTAPEVDDTVKPILDLANSTNASWVYTEFADTAKLRSGRWSSAVLSAAGPNSAIYTDNHGANIDPATEMGMVMRTWQRAGRQQGETARLEWRLYQPAGITAISSSGEKYRVGSSWPAIAALQHSKDGASWGQDWNETLPVNASTWTVWTRSGVSLSTTPRYVRFLLGGSIAVGATNEADFEIGDATLTLDGNGIPLVSLLAEEASYYLNATITNNSTGDAINLAYPMVLNKTLIVDTDAHTVTYEGANAQAALNWSSVRDEWLKLLPGANTLQFDQVGLGPVSVVTKWRNRNT